MTRDILNKIAKAKNITLDWYDHVFAYINPNYTKVFVNFGQIEVCGGSRVFYNTKTVVLSISAIQKLGEIETDYTTQGWTWLNEIR